MSECENVRPGHSISTYLWFQGEDITLILEKHDRLVSDLGHELPPALTITNLLYTVSIQDLRLPYQSFCYRTDSSLSTSGAP